MIAIARLLGITVVAALLCATETAVLAVTLDVRGGRLYGAWGVPVGERLFDVEFVRTTDAVALIPNLEGFSNDLAARSLLDYVLIDSPLGAFDSIPGLVESTCYGFGHCSIYTGRDQNPFNQVLYVDVISNGPTEAEDSIGGGRYYPEEWGMLVWTQWSYHAAEPTTVPLLLGAGLAWWGATRRRMRRPAREPRSASG